MLILRDLLIILLFSNFMTNLSLLKFNVPPRVLIILQVHPEVKRLEKHWSKRSLLPFMQIICSGLLRACNRISCHSAGKVLAPYFVLLNSLLKELNS